MTLTQLIPTTTQQEIHDINSELEEIKQIKDKVEDDLLSNEKSFRLQESALKEKRKKIELLNQQQKELELSLKNSQNDKKQLSLNFKFMKKEKAKHEELAAKVMLLKRKLPPCFENVNNPQDLEKLIYEINRKFKQLINFSDFSYQL